MTFTIDVDNIENNNFQLTEDGNGNLVLTHKSTGATFDYDSTNNQWVVSDGISTPALEADRVHTDSVTMFVREDGSDSNDGLSAAAAKKTINAAISDAPLQGDQSTSLVIDVGSDTISEPNSEPVVDLKQSTLASIKIVGETDTSDNPVATLAGQSGITTVREESQTNVILRNLVIKDGIVNISCTNGGGIITENCQVENASRANTAIGRSASLVADSDSVFDNSMESSATLGNVYVVGNASIKIDGGTVIGDGGGNAACYAKQNAYLIITSGSVIDNDNTGNNAIKGEDSADIKIGSNTTFENAGNVVRTERGCTIKFADRTTVTLNNVAGGFGGGQGSLWYDFNGGDQQRVYTLPKQSGKPDVFPSGGNGNGMFAFNLNSERPIAYAASKGVWLQMGREILESNTTTITAGGLNKTTVSSSDPIDVAFNVDGIGGDAEVEYTIKDETEDTTIIFSEVIGANDADLTYKIYRL